jgi:hypothetical protein
MTGAVLGQKDRPGRVPAAAERISKALRSASELFPSRLGKGLLAGVLDRANKR